MRFLVAAAFVLLAGWFVTVSGRGVAPAAPGAQVPSGAGSRRLARTVLGDPPTSSIGGLALDCVHCHSLFPLRPDPLEVLAQHAYIDFDHGIVDRCDCCHSRENQEKLLLPRGVEIGFAEVERLCESCHGPTFRDWERGIHGKTVGSWDPGSPEHERMRCTECHDPHRPAFGTMKPLPPPSTLRMRVTEPAAESGAPVTRNPLILERGPSGGGDGDA